MLSLQKIQGFSFAEKIAGECWHFDKVANFEGVGFSKRLCGAACCCVANSMLDSSSDDSLNDKLSERRLCSFKGQSISRKSNRNALITSIHSLGVLVDGVITKDVSIQASETNFDQFEQLAAEDGRIRALANPRVQTASTSPKLLQETNRQSKRRVNSKALLHEFPNHNRIEHARRDFTCEIGNGPFVMEDGESYTSFSVGKDGLPIVCNSKGCRPLSESEKQSSMYIAHVLRSINGREMDEQTLRAMEQKSNVESNFRGPAPKCCERAKLLRKGDGDNEATQESFDGDLEASLDASVLASYAWLQWAEVDES